MDYFELARVLRENVTELKRVEVERHWAFDDEDMPSVNIRETEFSSTQISISAIKSDFHFVVMLHATTKKISHEDDVKSYRSIRQKVISEVLRFNPNIELIGGKSVGEGAEFTYLGTTLLFKIKRCQNAI